MRKFVVAMTAAAFAAGMAVSVAEAQKAPAKTTLGCIKGKEKWNAVDGKCVANPKKGVKKA